MNENRIVTQEQFMEWVTQMCRLFKIDKSAKMERICTHTYVYNRQNPKLCGLSICSESDKFNNDVGLAIAYARYARYTVPKVGKEKIVPLSSLIVGDMFIFKNKSISDKKYLVVGLNILINEVVCYELENDYMTADLNSEVIKIEE